MHLIDTPTATSDGRFTEGDPLVPTPATVVSAKWLNCVQDEIANVIRGADFTLDADNNAQLFAAIQSLASAITVMVGATAAADGSAGAVPAPAKGDQAKYLRGDGAWSGDVVTKSGTETITGSKSFKGGAFLEVVPGNPTGGALDLLHRFVDGSDNEKTCMSSFRSTDGVSVELAAKRVNVEAKLQVVVDSTNTARCFCPTPPAGDNNNAIATTAWVRGASVSAAKQADNASRASTAGWADNATATPNIAVIRASTGFTVPSGGTWRCFSVIDANPALVTSQATGTFAGGAWIGWNFGGVGYTAVCVRISN